MKSFGSGTIAAVVGALILSQTAQAGGPVAVEPTPSLDAPAEDWSGPYFGFALASPRGDNAWRQASDGLALEPGDWSGTQLIVSLGHDWQRGRLTYGLQLSAGAGSIAASPVDALFISCSSCDTQASNLISLRGRVGLAAGTLHIFATGGLARADVTTTDLFGLRTVARDTLSGWTVGLGVEHRIDDNLSVSLSYDRVDLGTLALPAYLPTGETDVIFGLVQVGLNLRW